MMDFTFSRYSWYRQFRGGYWVWFYMQGWQRVSEAEFDRENADRLGKPEWSLESFK